MNKRIPLIAALLLCLACLALGAALALLWSGRQSLPQAPQMAASTPVSTTAQPSAAPTPTPESETEEVPDGDPAMDDNGLPKDRVYITEARKSYVDGTLRLKIPKLDVDVPVLNGTDADTLLRGVGLYEYAQLPSEGGANVSIAGHRNGLRGGQITDNMPFYYINTLTEGDYLYLVDDQTIYQYLWECTQVIEPDDWTPIFNQGYGCVTLTTCTPIGVADHRLVVRGELVATYPLSEEYPYPSDTSKE
ncbi:sortase [Flavonifractor hominis]|uniref:Class E sortase n=1 Tax=Flavonifractor hominis TaxID=3133178 RepID=A0ABV1EPE9_9FIRM